jgi:hypothetical protein
MPVKRERWQYEGGQRGLGDYCKHLEEGAGLRKDLARTYSLHLSGCNPVGERLILRRLHPTVSTR